MSTSQDDPDATYLPERYRQQVKVKKQRRMYKKLMAAGVVIMVVTVLYLLLSGMLPSLPASTPLKSPVTPTPVIVELTMTPMRNITVVVTPDYELGTGISALHPADVLSLKNAISFLREDYPEETFTLMNVNLTDRYPDLLLYEFRIQPVDHSSTGTPFTVFEDAATGEPYTPGQESAHITAKMVQDLAKKAFPAIPYDQVRGRYSAGPDSGRTWNFSLVKGTTPVLAGSMDAETGLIVSFTRTIQKMGRPADVVLDKPVAQEIAEQYISDKNGPVEVNLSESRYSPMGSPSDPMAGQYVFIYSRIVNDIPCEEDRFIVGVDSTTGEITSYERHWSAPDNAFSVASDPLILKREATFTVLQQAKEKYPEWVNGLRIVSAEIRWKDQHPIGVTPRPGSIPLAWKVTFEDDITRGNNSAQPAVAWVDAQTGSILNFEYRH